MTKQSAAENTPMGEGSTDKLGTFDLPGNCQSKGDVNTLQPFSLGRRTLVQLKLDTAVDKRLFDADKPVPLAPIWQAALAAAQRIANAVPCQL